MITDKNIYLQVKRTNSGGYKTPTVETEKMKVKKQQLKEDKLNEDEMIIMKEYARYLPQGNRKLKLNMKELKDTLLSKALLEDPLTKTSGLNQGGNISLNKTKQTYQTQSEYIKYSIENKHRLKTNPNFTSWKNNIKLK
jgi:hypothetical protein